MICPTCGNNNIQGNFCTKCGQNLQITNTYAQQTNNTGSIIVHRDGAFVASLVSFDIFVDGYLMGSVKNNSQTQIPLFYGTHTIEIKQGFNKSAIQQVVISDQSKNVYINVAMKMGLLQNEIIVQNMYVMQ